MNKTELVDAIAKDSGLTRADSSRALDSLLTTVSKTLKKGDEVAITGFGKFSVVKRGARTGRTPRPGSRSRSRLRRTRSSPPAPRSRRPVAGRRK